MVCDLKQTKYDQPAAKKKKKKKIPGHESLLTFFSIHNNFVWESCHRVSTETTNGIVPRTSVSDTTLILQAEDPGLLGLHKLPQRNWKSLVR